MTAAQLSSLFLFALVSVITPGPNNIMVMTSGVNFGLRATMPHILGVLGGVLLVMLLVGAGLYGLLLAFPWLYVALRMGSIIYLVYLAWRVATADGLGSSRTVARPQTFLQASTFQWVNPKVWATGLAAISAFGQPAHMALDVGTIIAVFMVVSLPALLMWTAFGTVMRQALHSHTAVRTFNVTMAVLLLLSIAPVLGK